MANSQFRKHDETDRQIRVEVIPHHERTIFMVAEDVPLPKLSLVDGLRPLSHTLASILPYLNTSQANASMNCRRLFPRKMRNWMLSGRLYSSDSNPG